MSILGFSKCGNYASIETRVISASFRDIGASDEVVRGIDHKGWWTNHEMQEESYRGHVWQMPARKGRTLFLAGYTESMDCGYVVLDASGGKLRLFDTARDAALAGDELARVNADNEAHYQDLATDEAEAEFDVANERAKFRHLTGIYREQRTLGAVSGRLCEDLKERGREAHAAFKAALESLIEARALMARYNARGY